jgi:hypothetical protein
MGTLSCVEWLGDDTTSRSRGPICPRLAVEFPYPPVRGRRECRVHAAPVVSCAIDTKNTHTSIQVQRRHPTFPAQWLYDLYRALPGRAGLVVTVALEKLASQELDASIGASGPHDFAVRISTVRQRRIHVHRIPSRACDDRETPLIPGRDEIDILLIWVGRQRNF